MNRLLIVFVICSTACIISCNKPDTEPPPPPPVANGLLKKTFFSKSSADSIVWYYSYNPDNTLDVAITTTYNIVTIPSSHTTAYKYYWNTQQRLASVAVKDQNQTDSTFTYYFYENSTSANPFSRSTKHFISPGFIILDSLRFIYDVAGNISKIETYSSPNWPSEPVSKSGSSEWRKIDGQGNLTEKELHSTISLNPVKDTMNTQFLYKYDNKENPFKNIPDYLGLRQSKNNVIEQKLREANIIQGGYNQAEYTVTYTFDNKDRPVSSIFYPKTHPSDISTTYYYYYD